MPILGSGELTLLFRHGKMLCTLTLLTQLAIGLVPMCVPIMVSSVLRLLMIPTWVLLLVLILTMPILLATFQLSWGLWLILRSSISIQTGFVESFPRVSLGCSLCMSLTSVTIGLLAPSPQLSYRCQPSGTSTSGLMTLKAVCRKRSLRRNLMPCSWMITGSQAPSLKL